MEEEQTVEQRRAFIKETLLMPLAFLFYMIQLVYFIPRLVVMTLFFVYPLSKSRELLSEYFWTSWALLWGTITSIAILPLILAGELVGQLGLESGILAFGALLGIGSAAVYLTYFDPAASVLTVLGIIWGVALLFGGAILGYILYARYQIAREEGDE